MSEDSELEKYGRTQEIIDRVRDEWESEDRSMSVQWLEDGQSVKLMPEDGRRFPSFEGVCADIMHDWRSEKNVGDLFRYRNEKYVQIAADKEARNRSDIIE